MSLVNSGAAAQRSLGRADWYAAGVAACVAVAFGLRFWQLGRAGLGVEEAAAWHFAGRPLDEIFSLALTSHQSSLLPFVVDFWRHFAGSSEFALRWPALAAGVLAVPVIYQLARRAIEMLRAPRD